MLHGFRRSRRIPVPDSGFRHKSKFISYARSNANRRRRKTPDPADVEGFVEPHILESKKRLAAVEYGGIYQNAILEFAYEVRIQSYGAGSFFRLL